MPRVKALLGPWFRGVGEYNVFVACEEVIPSALNTALGPLNPGNILFSHQHVAFGLERRYDLFIEVEAEPFKDRIGEWAAQVARKKLDQAFAEIFPEVRTLVRLSFPKSYWTPNKTPFDKTIDMSIEAAIARAKDRMPDWPIDPEALRHAVEAGNHDAADALSHPH